jgi:hypothetical protein
MALISRQLVLKKLAIAFPDAAVAAEALKALDRYGPLRSEIAVDGVHLAIIKLSEGRLWRLRELVQEARHDFRDVLYPAQAPEVFRLLREKPRGWAKIPIKEPLSPGEILAMEERDQKQWIEWLTS